MLSREEDGVLLTMPIECDKDEVRLESFDDVAMAEQEIAPDVIVFTKIEAPNLENTEEQEKACYSSSIDPCSCK